MKYLRRYERWGKKTPKFKVGDFVELDLGFNFLSMYKLNVGKILSYSKIYNSFEYNVDVLSNSLLGGKFEMKSVREENLTRKLTPEEIEDFLLNLNAEKYNL